MTPKSLPLPRSALMVVALAAVLGGPVPASAEEQPRIVAIEVKGLRTLTEAEFLGRISARVGDPFSAEQLGKDLTRLATDGIIANWSMARTPEGGAIVTFNVTREPEAPEIVSVKFKGGIPGEVRDLPAADIQASARPLCSATVMSSPRPGTARK